MICRVATAPLLAIESCKMHRPCSNMATLSSSAMTMMCTCLKSLRCKQRTVTPSLQFLFSHSCLPTLKLCLTNRSHICLQQRRTPQQQTQPFEQEGTDRKSTRLNSSH